MPRPNLFGGSGNDAATGGSSADLLFGGAGNDALTGGDGNDQMFGEGGNDRMVWSPGGDGNDQMFGEGGNDRMVWSPGDDDDLMEGGAGTDTAEVNGGNGAETFTPAANGARVRFDRVDPAPFSSDVGTTESIVLNADGGNDTVNASALTAGLARLTVDGGAGDDAVTGSQAADVLLGGDGNDLVDGGRGDDVGLLGAGDDTFIWDSGEGNDVVEGQAGFDAMGFDGNNANERIDISANGGRVRFFRDVAVVNMALNDVERIDFLGGGAGGNVVIQ